MNPLPLLIGAGIAMLGFFQLRKSIRLAKNGIKMEAEIVAVNARESTDIDEDGTTSTSTSYYPVFKFDYNQKPYKVESNIGFGNSRKCKVGKYLKIVFLPNEPEKTSVQNFGNNWFMPVVLIIVGVIIAVFAFIEQD